MYNFREEERKRDREKKNIDRPNSNFMNGIPYRLLKTKFKSK